MDWRYRAGLDQRLPSVRGGHGRAAGRHDGRPRGECAAVRDARRPAAAGVQGDLCREIGDVRGTDREAHPRREQGIDHDRVVRAARSPRRRARRRARLSARPPPRHPRRRLGPPQQSVAVGADRRERPTGLASRAARSRLRLQQDERSSPVGLRVLRQAHRRLGRYLSTDRQDHVRRPLYRSPLPRAARARRVGGGHRRSRLPDHRHGDRGSRPQAPPSDVRTGGRAARAGAALAARSVDDASREFYRLLAREVDVRGTTAAEEFEIERLKDGSVDGRHLRPRDEERREGAASVLPQDIPARRDVGDPRVHDGRKRSRRRAGERNGRDPAARDLPAGNERARRPKQPGVCGEAVRAAAAAADSQEAARAGAGARRASRGATCSNAAVARGRRRIVSESQTVDSGSVWHSDTPSRAVTDGASPALHAPMAHPNAERGISLAFIVLLGGCSAAEARTPAERATVQHVLLLSVDGMHASDLARWVESHPDSALARLSRNGMTFSDARSPTPSDSFPGLLTLVTGGTPRSTGVYYDDSYDRTLFPPGSNCSGSPGTEVVYDDTVDLDSSTLFTGIDPKNLPLERDASGCRPVFPHAFVKVNTVFEVVKAAGRRSAWSDKHPAYDLVNGPSGKGVDELYTPEINSPIANGRTVQGIDLAGTLAKCDGTN